MNQKTAAVALTALLLAGCQNPGNAPGTKSAARDGDADAGAAPAPYVVVATLDTGTNPFHPAFRRAQDQHPAVLLPGYPAAAQPLALAFEADILASITASRAALDSLDGSDWPRWVPGTNLIGLWADPADATPIFDRDAVIQGSQPNTYHGARASSQIAGTGYGMAEDAWLVIMDRTAQGSLKSPPTVNAEGLRWAADQRWIDIIHVNMHNIVPLSGFQGVRVPLFEGYPEAAAYAVEQGKLVVTAAGNWFVEPTEFSPHTGPNGILIAGANDNCGYTDYSNPNPHVVMDGYGTVAAADDSYGEAEFSGTSSASPRTTGYAASLLLALRRAVDDRHGFRDGHLIVIDDPARIPESGPLADGRLHASELHEAIRKTADPNPHDSRFDGDGELLCIPQPVDLAVAFYPKMGYGEVSEHTFGAALAVLLGEAPMPDRAVEDAFYGFSETLRDTIW